MNVETIRDNKVKILLVDDTPESLIALEAILGKLGQEMVQARSGAEALQRVLADDFAAILLDVRMPGMDGLETAAMIRQRERSRHTPIIFLTAFGDSETSLRSYHLGAVDYLVKPIQPEVLISKVAAFINMAKSSQLLRMHAALLEAKNIELENAIAQRKQAEEEVRVLNHRLEDRLTELNAVNEEKDELYLRIKKLDELKTRFFADISHEMRTPLSLMLGPTEKLLQSGVLADDQRRSVESLGRHLRALLNHVNDLLEISKLDAGKVEVSYSNVDLAQIALLAASNFDDLAAEREIQFSVETAGSMPAQMDSEKLERILMNLLSNAFKYTPDGGRVRLQLRMNSGKMIIEVADSGPGIPPAERDLIFDRFQRGKSAEFRRFGGTGLGLAIVRQFVAMLGGAIRVDEAPEGGALFCAELPVTAPAGVYVSAEPAKRDSEVANQVLDELHLAREHEEDARKAAEPPPPRNDPRLLVIEDNPAMRRFITEALSENFQVETASDGEDGLAKALAMRPDLILTDYMMPRMGARQLLAEVGHRPELAGVPVVVLTARADPELCADLLREGARDYLVKPFSVAELRLRVENLVAMKRARELIQGELESRSQDLEKLVAELALRKREAEAAHSEAEAANRAKDDFLATVSHELRTPLTAVLGWVRLLRTRPFDQTTTNQALETIDRNAKIQARLIDEILDVSRIVSGKLRLEFQPVDLRRVIEAAIEGVRPTAEAKGVLLEPELDPEARPAWGDASRLQQVVWNLLSNAVKFTRKGGRVDVQLLRSGPLTQIVVRDTGQGIDPRFLPYVFDRFRQGDNSDTRSRGGLGLGLAIVSHLVKLHGGKVEAGSPGENMGATFTITLPLLSGPAEGKLPEAEAARAATSRAQSENGVLDGVRVLVVEDEADAREVFCQALRQCGASVTAVGSAAEGMDMVRKSPPDVILTDLQMPDQDGYFMIRKVREWGATEGRFIPAAALTAHVRAEDKGRALSAGFQRHVPKPVEPSELVSVVAELVGRSSN